MGKRVPDWWRRDLGDKIFTRRGDAVNRYMHTHTHTWGNNVSLLLGENNLLRALTERGGKEDPIKMAGEEVKHIIVLTLMKQAVSCNKFVYFILKGSEDEFIL